MLYIKEKGLFLCLYTDIVFLFPIIFNRFNLCVWMQVCARPFAMSTQCALRAHFLKTNALSFEIRNTNIITNTYTKFDVILLRNISRLYAQRYTYDVSHNNTYIIYTFFICHLRATTVT